MSLEEKLGQLAQFTPGQPEIERLITEGKVGSVFSLAGAEVTNRLQRIAVEKSRLGIPLIFGNDVIHGHRTIFPIPPGLASSWDPRLVELSARIAAREARADGIAWTFSPMVDIARDPRWGRIAEGAGEDPFLGSAIAAAYVRGYQGSDLSAADSILACAKHFAAYGAAEAGRDYNTVDMSERTLRQVYLPPFQAAVDQGVATIMTAFNALNGVPATANHYLFEQVLRREWNFGGFVVSDYQAVEQLIPHGVAATPQQAAIKAITAGVDMNMVDNSYATLAAAVHEGRLSEQLVDLAVRRVLRAKLRLGLFDQPYTDERLASAVIRSREHQEAARAIARKSIVLLKNEGGLLPLSKTTPVIAVVGPLADSRQDMLGSWYSGGKPEEAVSLLEGIREKISSETRLLIAQGTGILEGTDAGIAAAVEVASQADLIIAALGEEGRMSGEANSRVSLDLPGRQQELLEALVATGKPVVLVAMSGRPLTIRWAAEHVPAIVWPWFPGSQGGHALADILFGDADPSAKLPVTFPRSVGQIPIYYAHLNTGRPPSLTDRYTSKYLDSPNEPLYPFGHGLSYTRFEYANLRVSSPSMPMDGSLTVSADVRNVGSRPGDEIVQFYVNDPIASISRPVKELRGFERIALGPGESRRVEFTVTPDALAFWGEDRWTVEPGTFHVWIGPSSAEGLRGSFELLAR
jgi:beta-glucosidase